MQFIAGETITIKIADSTLTIKIEDASKSEAISARVEQVNAGSTYEAGQIYEFNRNDIKEAD